MPDLIAEKTITVAIAEDHPIFRKGIIEILAKEHFCVVCEAADGRELLDALMQMKEMPDIILLDVRMPGMDGYTAAIAIRTKWPAQKIIALSMYYEEMAVIKMLQSGAHSYLDKMCEPKELVNCILSVHKHGYYHSQLVPVELFVAVRKKEVPDLTEKDLQFISLCCSQRKMEEIADIMLVSKASLEKIQHSIGEKIGITRRTDLAMLAKNMGLGPFNTPPPPPININFVEMHIAHSGPVYVLRVSSFSYR